MLLARDVEGFRAHVRSDAFLADFTGRWSTSMDERA
jgi:hypothetical protein